MVTAMVVMTQSEYIAHGKQGQDCSRPEKGCRGHVRNNQPEVQRCVWNSTFQVAVKKEFSKGEASHQQTGTAVDILALTAFSSFVSVLQNSFFLQPAPPGLGKFGKDMDKRYIFASPLKKGSLLFASPTQSRDCAHFLKSTCSVSPCPTIALGIYTFTIQQKDAEPLGFKDYRCF